MVKFENIEIKYGDFVAIENLNLDIKEGEFFTFLGPSGCGKTTSLRALVGFLSPSKGKVYVGDKDVTNLPVEKRNIGMVFQSYALFPTMSVYDNIAFGMKVKKASKTEIDQKVHEVAAKIKITESQLKKNVSDLSGGQQQRVALARAIVLEPKILCLDEPLSNLDAKLRIDMRMELKRLQKELGITTLYVTHDQEEALTLSDRIAVFNNGYVEQVGTPYEIYNESKSEFVCDFIGDINRLKGGVKVIVDHAIKHKTPVFVMGNVEELEKLWETLPKQMFTDIFIRPINVVEMVENIKRQMDEYYKMKKRTILAVDDSGVILRNIKTLLEDKYQVIPVNSSEMAIKYLALNIPDLILLDYEMPIVDGKQFMQMIREDTEFQNIPIIFLTGKNDAQTVMDVMSLKPNGYLLKSMDAQKLHAAIDDFFKKQTK